MINAVIIDDEPNGVKNLQALLLAYCPNVRVVGESGDISSAYQLICNKKPDIVFLDIEMPFGNGFELLDKIYDIKFEVIFVTAFEKYALNAIRKSACDYILKPIDINDLVNAVEKATARITQKNESYFLKKMLDSRQPAETDKKMALPTLQGMVFVKLSDIIYCEAEGSYTWFHFIDGSKILIAKNIGEYDDLLTDRGFIRVHHSRVINYNHVVEFRKGNSPTLIMSNGASIPVSHRKRDILMQYFNSQIISR
ncbi:MAG TPA: LytTR family DNA-binding domain-containing protein [Chitinophagales bacterium]|nr:LytTR family DNA-binding domain-containing protein [Chitinophagales bacterium]